MFWQVYFFILGTVVAMAAIAGFRNAKSSS